MYNSQVEIKVKLEKVHAAQQLFNDLGMEFEQDFLLYNVFFVSGMSSDCYEELEKYDYILSFKESSSAFQF